MEQQKRLDPRLLPVIATALLVALPCLIYGFPFYGDDSIWTAIYYSNFSEQFWTGDLYPRWLEALNGGLGDPTAYYYPPVAAWITSILKLHFAHDPHAWRQLGLSAAAAVVVSGLSSYAWLKRTFDRKPALIGSLLYLVLPYHLNVDLYTRGALAELWTFAWMPLVLWSIDSIAKRHRRAVVALAVSYGVLIMTHLPTTVIFSVVPVAYSLVLAKAHQRAQVFLRTLAGVTLGVGLSAVYVIPALAMQEFIFHTTEGISSHYYFGNWFLFTALKWFGRGSEYFFAAIGALALAGAAFVVSRVVPVTHLNRRGLFWLLVAFGSFLMMTPLSRPVWESLVTLQKVQFPFRFNTVLTLATAVLVAIAFEGLQRSRRALIISQLAILLLGAGWIYVTLRTAYHAYPANYIDQVVLDGANKRLEQERDTKEFRPRWVVSIDEGELDALLRRIGQTDGRLIRVNVVKGAATVTVERWTPGQIVLRVDTAADATLTVSRFYFPGWGAFLDESRTSLRVQPSKPGGLLSVTVPNGNHQIVLELRKRMPEMLGQLATGISVVVLLFVSLRIRISRRNSVIPPTAVG